MYPSEDKCLHGESHLWREIGQDRNGPVYWCSWCGSIRRDYDDGPLYLAPMGTKAEAAASALNEMLVGRQE